MKKILLFMLASFVLTTALNADVSSWFSNVVSSTKEILTKSIPSGSGTNEYEKVNTLLYKASAEKDQGAEKILLEIARNGNIHAQGWICFDAPNERENYKGDCSFEYFKKLADANNSDALFEVGTFYDRGLANREVDPVKGLEYTKRSASLNNPFAQEHLAGLYFLGTRVNKDLKKSREYATKAAEQGMISSMNALAYSFLDGENGFEKNEKEAFKWFLKLGQKDNIEAMAHLGNMYENGIGTEKDLAEATYWYKKVADSNHPWSHDAANWMASKYFSEKSYRECFNYAKKGADGNLTKSYTILGILTYRGDGVEKNYYQAFTWFKKAAEGAPKDANAMNWLASLYLNGEGTTQDFSEAIKWLEMSAKYYNRHSMNQLGNIYFGGQLVTKDHVKAYAYYNIAANGYEEAKKSRDALIKQMSQSEIAQGQKLSKQMHEEWKLFHEKEAKVQNTAQKDVPKLARTEVVAGDDLAKRIEAISPSKVNKKRWLLAISVENYDSTAPVVFARKSSDDFVVSAQKLFGISEQNTIYISDNRATTGAIKDAVIKISELAEKGDTIYFYYSGHGIPSPSDNESYILPKDKSVEYVSKEPELKLSHIYKTLESSRADKVVAVVDACFSGTTDGKQLYSGTAAGLLRSKAYTPSSKMVILSAGKDNQFSNSYDAKGHRLFSYFVIKALLDGRKNINDLYQDVRLKVKDESRKKGGSYEQEPQMVGNAKLGLW